MPNWPSKPETRENYDDFDNGFESGQRVMYDAFMKVIKSHNVCSQHHPDHWDANCPMCNTTIESQPRIHSCKCRTGDGGAMTVKMLDEGLCQCPRCGGIIVSQPKGLEPRDRLKISTFFYDKGIKNNVIDEIIDNIFLTFGQQPQRDIPSASEMKEVARKALENKCKCSIPHKKIRIICDAIHDLISGGKNEGN